MSEATGQVRRRGSSRLLLVWVVLAALVGTIAFLQYRDRIAAEDESESHATRWLLPVSMEKVGIVELFDQGTLHRFERDEKGAWFYHGHAVDPTAQGAHTHQADPVLSQLIDKAFKGFGRTHSERQFPRGPLEKDYGTVAPEMFILLYAPKDLKPLARIAVGRVAPDHISRYVLPDGSPVVVTIADYQIDNLRALVKAANGQMTPAQLEAILSGSAQIPEGPKPTPGAGSPGAGAPSKF
jgi:hypothetical protein